MSLSTYFANCFWLLLPILVWNQRLYKKLPPLYQANNWDAVPGWINWSENLLRILVFAGMLFLRLELKSALQVTGLIIYIVGTLVYFLSWMMQTSYAHSRWSQSIWGVSALAHTPVIWLLGIGLIGQRLIFDLAYTCWIYILLAALFTLVHSLHAGMAYRKNYA